MIKQQMSKKTDSMNQSDLYHMLYLVSCGINKVPPDIDRVKEMNLESVFTVSKEHSLNAIACMALELSGIEVNQIIQRWKESKNKAFRKNILLDAGRVEITDFLEQNGIRYLTLKGIVMKELYPDEGMRQMSDQDILFDENYRYQVRKYMLSEGYALQGNGKGHHDSYIKEPVFHYEMHTSLHTKEEWIRYYDRIWERLKRNEDSLYGYHFTKEDFYIYITTHTYKHFENMGSGLRSLLDTYVILRKYGDSLDWMYIGLECEKLGISEFEMRCRQLAGKVFQHPKSFETEQLSSEESTLLESFLSYGTYGCFENGIRNRITDLNRKSHINGKWVYLFRRVFPDWNYVKNYYPVFYHNKILLPILPIWRGIKGITVSRKKIVKEMHFLCHYDSKQ